MRNKAYLLQGTFFSSAKNKNDIFEVNELFANNNPIQARNEAFNRFLSYLEVFLDSLDITYRSFDQAVNDLHDFIHSGNRKYFLNDPDLQIDMDFDKGLYLYFVPDTTDKSYTAEKRIVYNQKYLIHCFTNNAQQVIDELQRNLNAEYQYYEQNGLEIQKSVKTD